jgi:hypothetical protein
MSSFDGRAVAATAADGTDTPAVVASTMSDIGARGGAVTVSDPRCTAKASSGGSNGTGDDSATGELKAEQGTVNTRPLHPVVLRVLRVLRVLACALASLLSVGQSHAVARAGCPGAPAHTPDMRSHFYSPFLRCVPFHPLSRNAVCASCLSAAAKDSNRNG